MESMEITKKHCLQVNMLGHFSVMYDGHEITLPNKVYSKPTELFILMAYYGAEGIERKKVLDRLYSDEEVFDGTGNLRVVAFRLRKQLVDLGVLCEDDKINDKGIFHLTQDHLEVVADVRRFEELIDLAIENPDCQEEYLREACALYKGEFLSELVSNIWVAGKQVRYRDQFFKCARQFMKILEKKKGYEEMLQLVQFITRIYPYEEWYLAEVDILIHTEQWKAAWDTMERATKEMMIKMGVKPSDEMEQKSRLIQEHLRGSYKSLRDIRDRLLENNDHGGATYFPYHMFVESYRYEVRKMERNGLPICLALFSVVEGNDHGWREGVMTFDQKMEVLGNAIQTTLRRTDIYTRFNKNQYLILIYDVRQKDCAEILARVDRTFRRITGSRRDEVYTSIIPAQWDAVTGGSISAELHFQDDDE